VTVLEGVRTRAADAGDVDAVRRCARLAYQPWIDVLGFEPEPLSADYGRLIADGVVWVAVLPGYGVVGFLVMLARKDSLLLDNVAVLPAVQGRGVLRRLFGLARRHARRLGLDRLELYTNVGMSSNIAIYRRLGFAETDRCVEHGFERVYMRALVPSSD